MNAPHPHLIRPPKTPAPVGAGAPGRAAEYPLQPWRTQVLELLLRTVLIVGVVAYVPSVFQWVQLGQWGIIVVDTVFLVVLFVVWRWKSLAYAWRALVFCAMLYMLGTALAMLLIGLGLMFLLAQSALATVLLGLRAGLWTVGINTATPFILGLMGYGAWMLSPLGFDGRWDEWGTLAVNFLYADLLAVLAVGLLLRRVEQALQTGQAAQAALAQGQAGWQRQVQALQAQLERLPVGVLALHPDGRIAQANPAALQVLQAHDSQAAQGQPLSQFMAEDDTVRWQAALQQAQREGTATWTGELTGWQAGRTRVGVDLVADASTPAASSAAPAWLAALHVLRDEAPGSPGTAEAAAGASTPAGPAPELARALNNALTVLWGEAERAQREPGSTEQAAPSFTPSSQSWQRAAVRGGEQARRWHGDAAGALPPPPDGPVPTGAERVLLVEPDDLVREHLGSLLASLGYEVESVAEAGQALDRLRQAPYPALVLTETALPGDMDGWQLGQAVQALHPKVRVLHSTSELGRPVRRHTGQRPDAPVLHKPYGRAELAMRLRAVLDDAGMSVSPSPPPGP